MRAADDEANACPSTSSISTVESPYKGILGTRTVQYMHTKDMKWDTTPTPKKLHVHVAQAQDTFDFDWVFSIDLASHMI